MVGWMKIIYDPHDLFLLFSISINQWYNITSLYTKIIYSKVYIYNITNWIICKKMELSKTNLIVIITVDNVGNIKN